MRVASTRSPATRIVADRIDRIRPTPPLPIWLPNKEVWAAPGTSPLEWSGNAGPTGSTSQESYFDGLLEPGWREGQVPLTGKRQAQGRAGVDRKVWKRVESEIVERPESTSFQGFADDRISRKARH
jgi:hypothetical protein